MTILHSTDFFKAGISTVAIDPRPPQSAFPEHHHDFHEIVIVEQGSGIHVFNGQPYTIGGGSVCFIRDHDRHLYEHTDNLCLTNVLYRAPDAFRFLAGVSQLLPQEQEGNYPSHWRVNQTVLQQVRHIVAQIEAVGSDTDTHAVASREILFMQLLVLLRKSSLAEEATNNDARLNQLLAWLEDHFAQEICWEEVAAQFSLSLRTLHRPPPSLQLSELESGKHPAQQRLILEELLAHNLSMLALRAGAQRYHALPLGANDTLKNQLLASLPFKPTGAQARVTAEIEHDMALDVPMMRLVQGDVGSGKTLVAALAALRAIVHGKQVALMAPTELLAEQHANNFRNWFEPLGIEVGWLAGKQKGKARQAQQEAIASGEVQMIVGTHAIFQEQVQFNGLALVIIDEQHRFGVHQRLALWEKGQQQGFPPHQLIMTATPIPRTLAMTAYADLDTSIIDELPPGRTPVTTVAIPDTRRSDIIDRVRNACTHEGRQAYWVCTLIEESDLLEAQAAEATWEELKLALPELNIGLVHGRMKPAEKQAVMQAFKQGEMHLLVATTVIEVGVDVPNSSLMIIENPERLGLAQLHQRSNVAVLHAGGGSGQSRSCRGHGAGELGVDAVGRDVQQDVHGRGSGPQQAALFHAQRQNGGIGGSVVSFQPEV